MSTEKRASTPRDGVLIGSVMTDAFLRRFDGCPVEAETADQLQDWIMHAIDQAFIDKFHFSLPVYIYPVISDITDKGRVQLSDWGIIPKGVKDAFT